VRLLLLAPWLTSALRIGSRAPTPSLMATMWSESTGSFDLIREVPPIRPDLQEAHVSIRPAEGKGMGAFADEPLSAGTWVCAYQGRLVTLIETTQMYDDTEPEYLFMLTPDLYLDAMESTHFSRYFNHDERGTLNFTVSVAEKRVDFYAARDVLRGEELTFDYGAGYWAGSSQLLASGTDSRNFSLDRGVATPVGPPPLTPRTKDELAETVALPEGDARKALFRTLEYFGAVRIDENHIEIPMGIKAPAERVQVAMDAAPVEILSLAARRCIQESVCGVD